MERSDDTPVPFERKACYQRKPHWFASCRYDKHNGQTQLREERVCFILHFQVIGHKVSQGSSSRQEAQGRTPCYSVQCYLQQGTHLHQELIHKQGKEEHPRRILLPNCLTNFLVYARTTCPGMEPATAVWILLHSSRQSSHCGVHRLT